MIIALYIAKVAGWIMNNNTMELTIISECSLLESEASVRLHRNSSSGKVKFLALGIFKGPLQQEDSPYQFIEQSDHLDFIEVVLKFSFTKTRKVNCEELKKKISNTIG